MRIVPQKVELIDHMGSDLTVVNAARVSFAKQSDWGFINLDGSKVLKEQDQKLITYLAKNKHWTPFGHVFLSYRIKAPIFVARQLVKHQVGLVWNETSRRYVDDEPEFYFPGEWRGRPINAKQGSSDEVIELKVTELIDTPWQHMYEAKELYLGMIKQGVAPEQARIILPQNTMTEWIWSGSLMAFARVCNLRLSKDAQKETQEVASMINSLIPQELSYSWKGLMV